MTVQQRVELKNRVHALEETVEKLRERLDTQARVLQRVIRILDPRAGLVDPPAASVESPGVDGVHAGISLRPTASAQHNTAAPAAEQHELSTRELEVVALVGAGLRNREIARRLFITEDAIKKRLRSVFRKLRVRDRVAVALYATRNGIAKPT